MSDTVSYSYPDFVGAIYDYLLEFVRPGTDAIIWGGQNAITLPQNTNNYIIYYPQNIIRHGSTHRTYDPEAEETTLAESSELTVRVDCYCNTENGQAGIEAQIQAHNLEMVFKTPETCEFLKPYKMSPLYADSPQDTTVIQDDSGNYLKRWSVTLHFNFTNSYTVGQAGFSEFKPIVPNSISSSENGLHFADADVRYKET